jgi:hypothetical protein
MVINASGNVGIGTTAPVNGSKLNIYGSGIWDGACLTLTNTGTSGRSWTIFSTNSSFTQGAGKLLFYNTTGSSDAGAIDSSNNWGIGTTSPGQRLHVEGRTLINMGTGASTFDDLNIGGISGWSSGEAHRINFVYGTAASPSIFTTIESKYNGSTNKAELRFRNMYTSGGSTATTMTIIGGTGVGIGTESPSEALHVIGKILASDNITAYSDVRIKKDISTIKNALSTVQKLRGVSYKRIDTEQTGIGVIAQEVKEIIPEVVSGSEETQYSVAYGNMVGLLIEAIKEQQKQIEELKSLINNKH